MAHVHRSEHATISESTSARLCQSICRFSRSYVSQSFWSQQFVKENSSPANFSLKCIKIVQHKKFEFFYNEVSCRRDVLKTLDITVTAKRLIFKCLRCSKDVQVSTGNFLDIWNVSFVLFIFCFPCSSNVWQTILCRRIM